MVGILYAKGKPYPLVHSPLLEQITSSLIGTTMKHPSTIQQMLMTMVFLIILEIFFTNRKIDTGTNKDSYALNFGISATFSIPLDKGFQNQCKSLCGYTNKYTKTSIGKQKTRLADSKNP